jgi:signal transduction histidine kinase
MNIKNKLRAGIGFLFLMALISSGLADYYLTRLSNDSKAILKDNYRSLQYVKNMEQALDYPPTVNSSTRINAIESNLTKEEQNITEAGEQQLADSVRSNFERYRIALNDPLAVSALSLKIRDGLYGIMQLNMAAITKRDNTAAHTAHTAIIIVSLIGSLCFLVAFSFAVNFPGYIANPVIKNINEFQQINEAKTTFIATISHELKTPLAAIRMSLKLLDDARIGPVNDEQKQLLKNINDDTHRLLQITAELLDAAQVETGKINLNFGSTHPKNIVNYAVQAIKSLADQKELIIDIHCPDDLPNVMADLDKTTWVLINLLSNAVKYSPARSTINLDVQKVGAHSISFSVKDKGQGIDAKYLSRIFERYFRVPGAGDDTTGTGLGLAIAKDFIEAQGGSIRVESEPGAGSRFYFKLEINK